MTSPPMRGMNPRIKTLFLKEDNISGTITQIAHPIYRIEQIEQSDTKYFKKRYNVWGIPEGAI
jgi:hypothetical protein